MQHDTILRATAALKQHGFVVKKACYQDIETHLTDTCAYHNSALYFLRASRLAAGERGYAVTDGADSTLCFMGYRDNALYLLSNVWETQQEPLLKIARAATTAQPLIFKKVPVSLADTLQANSPLTIAAEGNGQFEDENSPEKGITLPLFADMQNVPKQLAKLSSKYNRFLKNNLQMKRQELRPGDALLPYLYAINKEAAFTNAYLEMSRYFETARNHALHCFVFTTGDDVKGVYLAEELTSECAGLYCAIGSRCHAGITEWMDVEVFQALHNRGFNHLLIGGSETAGVQHYVQKLHPFSIAEYQALKIWAPKQP